jgi:SNF2 family DNA or RNA helicase
VIDKRGGIDPQIIAGVFPYISMALEEPILLMDSDRQHVVDQSLANLLVKWDMKKSHKFEILTSLLEEYILEEKEKVVVFDYHPLILDMLYSKFSKYNPLVLHGGNTENRDSIVEEFKNNSKCKVLFASMLVLQTAVNLQFCHRVIYYNRTYSYTAWIQSQRRFWRIGQDQPVIINPIIFENTIDERLDLSLERKEDLNKNLFSKQFLSRKEIEEIFYGRL